MTVKNKVQILIVSLIVVSIIVIILIVKPSKELDDSYKDYSDDSVEFNVSTDEINNFVSYEADYSEEDVGLLDEDIIDKLKFGMDDEEVVVRCYKAAVQKYGDDVDFQMSDSLVPSTYEDSVTRMFLVNGVDVQFVITDENIIIID